MRHPAAAAAGKSRNRSEEGSADRKSRKDILRIGVGGGVGLGGVWAFPWLDLGRIGGAERGATALEGKAQENHLRLVRFKVWRA